MRFSHLRNISMCQFSTHSWSLSEDIARYQNFGFNSIGIWRRKIEDAEADTAIEEVINSKLAVSSVHWAGGFTGAEGATADALQDTFEAIQLADQLDAKCVLIHSGGLNGHIFNHADKIVSQAIAIASSYAEDCGVRLAIEPIVSHPFSPWTIYQNFEQYLDLLERFPMLGINLDLYHIGFIDEAFCRLDEYIDRVCLVQLADRTFPSFTRSQQKSNKNRSYRIPLGKGDIDIDRWLTRLHQLGYNGPYEIEIHGIGINTNDHYQLADNAADYLTTSSSIAS